MISRHLVDPKHADVLVGITNTAGTLPGVFAVALTGWLVDKTGGYTTSFLLIAGIDVVGAIVWLAFSTARPILDRPSDAHAIRSTGLPEELPAPGTI